MASAATLARPGSAEAVAKLLAGAGPRGTLPRGLGRSYGDVAQNAGGQVLDMTGLDRVLAFDRKTGLVTAEAGLSLDRLLRLAVPAGWFLTSTPGTRFVTVGGLIANDVHGKAHHLRGSIRRAVRGLELLTPAGDQVTVGPDQDRELFAATLGGLGLTGIIQAATLQLDPVETAWVRVDTERAADLDDLMDRMAGGDDAYRYSVAWVDCLARGRRLGRSVLTRGNHALAEELPADQRASARRFAPRRHVAVPPLPASPLRRPLARLFNEAWFARAPRREVGRLQPFTQFFYPLDALGSWNRLYGPRGFVQYQLAVPPGAAGTLSAIVELLAQQRCPSFLVVLKRFGPGGDLLSFPIAGWTLAVDIPAGQPGLGRLLDRCDELVAGAGGRVYLGKDARLRRAAFEAMYPELDRWRSVRARVDPAGRLRSDLGRRLGLIDER